MSMVETLAEDTVADSTWEMAPLNTAIARAREGPQVGKMDGEKWWRKITIAIATHINAF